MATEAHHKLGDISSSVPDLCFVQREDEDNYYGMWEFGFGFIDVRFPKSTTRELTEEEHEKYSGKAVAINDNYPLGRLNTRGDGSYTPI